MLTFPRDVPSHDPTAKPVALLSWLIRAYSHPAERVPDPCVGSGSTRVACALEGREFTGIELDPDHYAIAAQCLSLKDGGQR